MKSINLFLDTPFTRKGIRSFSFPQISLPNIIFLIYALFISYFLFGVNTASAEDIPSQDANKVIMDYLLDVDFGDASSPNPIPIPSMTDSISQFGITWTFDKDYVSGTFANGDYWVLGPVKIIKITPESVSGDRIKNGSMLNPFGGPQGYDSDLYQTDGGANDYRYEGSYQNVLNVALDVDSENPLVIPAENSLVSSISNVPILRTQINTMAILTVLSSIPAEGSFRPPYTGTDKTIYHNKSDIDYTKLTKLPLVASATTPNAMAVNFIKPWIDHVPGWLSQHFHPETNMPSYGQFMAKQTGDAMLTLSMNYTDAEKELLAIRLIQFGIDTYGLVNEGIEFTNNGGHMMGRKMPLLLAGVLLNDPAMIAKCDASTNMIFQDDQTHWYISQIDVGRYVSSPKETYLQADADTSMPEWGIQHSTWPNNDDRRWDEASYRDINYSANLGHILTARLMNQQSNWNWPPSFDYADRAWSIASPVWAGGTNEYTLLAKEMWENYR